MLSFGSWSRPKSSFCRFAGKAGEAYGSDEQVSPVNISCGYDGEVNSLSFPKRGQELFSMDVQWIGYNLSIVLEKIDPKSIWLDGSFIQLVRCDLFLYNVGLNSEETWNHVILSNVEWVLSSTFVGQECLVRNVYLMLDEIPMNLLS